MKTVKNVWKMNIIIMELRNAFLKIILKIKINIKNKVG
jgi:hypothetical protein